MSKRLEYYVKNRSDYDIYADYVAQCASCGSFDNTQSAEAREYVGEDGMVGFWVCDAIYALANAHPGVELHWIKAHDGSRWNEYADALATAYMRD